jgi:hypothetical protein
MDEEDGGLRRAGEIPQAIEDDGQRADAVPTTESRQGVADISARAPFTA